MLTVREISHSLGIHFLAQRRVRTVMAYGAMPAGSESEIAQRRMIFGTATKRPMISMLALLERKIVAAVVEAKRTAMRFPRKAQISLMSR